MREDIGMENENKLLVLKTLVDSMNQNDEMLLLEGATDQEIDSFEGTYGIKLPNEYREWLKLSDGGYLYIPAGVQLYGVSHNPVIDINSNERPNDEYIVIGALTTGDPILFKRDSAQILIYNQVEGIVEEDESYENFYDFLIDLPKILGIDEE